jgi:hypothetical protein
VFLKIGDFLVKDNSETLSQKLVHADAVYVSIRQTPLIFTFGAIFQNGPKHHLQACHLTRYGFPLAGWRSFAAIAFLAFL